MAVLFNVIWFLTWLPTGRPYYYWPMWPMLGTGIAAYFTCMGLDRHRNRQRDRNRDQHREQR